LRNVRASGEAAKGRFEGWRQATDRAEMARRFDVEQRKVTEILGIEAGYRYVDSPVIWPEPGEGPDPDNAAYVPTTWPGARLPHLWLEDGGALHDRIGAGYTLLRVGGTSAPAAPFEQAFRSTGAPFAALDIPDAAARELFGHDLVLVRPDLHVVWRGNQPPDSCAELATLATGWRLAPV
jgi:hypothetical protein